MNRFVLLSLLVLPLAACQTSETEPAEPTVTADTMPNNTVQPSSSVADATRQSLAAFQNNDADGIRATFAESDALVAIGTDPAEYFRGHDQTADVFTAQADAMSGMTVQPGDIEAYEQGDVGWSSSQPTFRFADGTELPIRLTLVFTREGGGWQVVQWHASLGVGNEEVTPFEDLPTE